jgi:protein-S-isoprenylcysteine O-methyltransferase Ste14
MSVTSATKRLPVLAWTARRFRQDLQFSRIFLVDLAVASAYAATTVLLLVQGDVPARGAHFLLFAGAAYGALFALKIALVVQLERRGGDAREFVGSEQLVTCGVYAVSRNPVYVVSLLQSLVWSLGLIGAALAGDPPCLLTLVAAPALLFAHLLGMDRLVVPHEEAALRARHPDAFAAYCARVNRWLGRRAQPETTSR